MYNESPAIKALKIVGAIILTIVAFPILVLTQLLKTSD